MPIFKWKKTRRYEVSSRNSYVVCVHLLDTSLIECTLTADSVGEECLENIAQRIELSQCEYFGLRYVNKKLQFRWVELDKPLKKQLDRYAHSPLLYFGVMYYVPDAQRIEDDMTRYQYYLQLKSDIIEGKLPCSTEKAVLLAAYSLQAELGDFDYERHTVENLKDAVLLPRNMAVDDRSLLELTQDIINNHQTLVRWSAATAEVEYILEAQQLEGYGVDYYSAKDHSGQEVLLGAYYLGIFVKILDCQQPVQHYKWAEITHLSCNKKHFTITTRHKEKPVQFTMDDPDTAKYIQRLFTLQMCFFTGRTAITTDPGHSVGSRTPDVPNSHVEVNTSQTSVPVDIGNASPASLGSTTIPASQFETTNHIAEPQFEPANPVTDTVDPSVTILNTPSALSTSSPDGRMYYSNGNIYSVNGSQGDNANSTTSPQSIRQSPHLPQQSPFVPQQSSSVPYHTSNSYLNSTPAPPSYRHTPDYETVMRQRVAQQQQIQQQQQQQQLAYLSNIINSQAHNAQHPETLAYSQPDIHHLQQTSFQPQALQQQTGDILPNGSAIHYVESSPSHHQHYPLRPVDRTSSLIIYPTYTTSPQEQQNTGNAVFNNQTDPSVTVSQYTNNYRAPPPYPRGASTSTPDLASQTMRSNMSSSPDLISRRNLIQNQGLMVQSFLDQSVENLALDTQKLLISQSTATRSKQILDDSSSLQSDAVSRDQYLSSSVNQAGSIPDVAHSAMMAASGSSSGLLPMQDYYTNTPQPQVIRSSGAVQRASSMHRSGGRSSSRSLPQYSHSNAQQQQLQAQQLAQQQQQAQQLAQQQAQQQQQLQQHQQQQQLPPADFSFSNPNSFDNPAFRDNLPLYLREMATEPNPKPANPTATQFQAASNQNAALQTSAVQNVVPQQPSTNQQKPTVTVPPGDSPQQTSAGPVVLRKKKSSKSEGDGTKEGDPDRDSKRLSMGALRMAALNGLTLSSGSVLDDAMGDEVDGITKETTPTEEVTRVPKDERRRQLEAKLVADQVFIEFETVPKKRMKCECNAAGQPANKERNRFKDVLPYDDNRVQLTPVKDNPMGYINASHVKLRIGDEELWYMATQGPLPNTVTDFWQVIWEQDVEVIAMLTKVQEHGKPKCHQYWPERLGPKNKVTHNQYQIVMKFSNNAGPYTTSGLLIKHLPSNRERLVWHLQYTDWPDHGCPEDVHGFLAFLDEVDAIKRQTQMQKSDSRRVPILVHCSAGVGRTGVVILTEAIKACLEHNENVDVPGMLSRLRDQRMHSVQTVSQYSFVYKTLVEYLKGSRLI